MRVINVSLNELETKLLMIGFQGENEITQVRIDAAEILTDHPNATPTLIAKPLFGFAYPVIVAKEGTDVVWNIDNSVLSFHGDGEIQLTFTEGTVIAKSYVGRIRIKRSLAVNGEAPDPIETWEQAATAKLAEVDAQISELEGMVDAAEAAKDEAQDIVDDAAADIQAAGATQIAAVEAKGEEVKESIPSDYTALTGEVSGLKSAMKNGISGANAGIGYFDQYGEFQRGTMTNGVLNPNASYRVSTDTIMHTDIDLQVKIADGFRIGVFYFVDGVYRNNSGYVTDAYKIPQNSDFKMEIGRTPEVIAEANILEFVHSVSFTTIVGEVVNAYNDGLSITLDASETYPGYYKLNSTPLTSSTDLYTKKYIIPTGTTKVYIKTRFSGLLGVAFSDITDPTTDYLGYPANCTKDPLTAYVSLTDHVKTYTLDRYYKCVYVPYYVPWGEPTVIAYRESAFDTFGKGIHPLDGKNILIFGDSITYTSLRWRDEFFRITRANQIACISYPGAHLTDYNNSTPLDGNYATTADGGVHNVVCNQVYYWLTNMPSEIEPDIIIVSASTNDTQSIAQLETDINVYTDSSGWLDVDTIERTSFEGAMRWITSKLRAQYPYAVIVFASPIQSAQAIHAMEYQLAKETKMEKVCKRLGANLIKATSESGITGEFEVNNGMGRYLIDGLHPNEYGGFVLGTYYANVLETIFKALPKHS